MFAVDNWAATQTLNRGSGRLFSIL
jgi:hypothetical protein